MLPVLFPIGALLAGIALLLLGSGLLNTLISLRGSLEGFSDATLGLLGSAYFLGFFLGTFTSPALIRRIGHIRAFAFFGAVAAACVLAHALVVNPWVWMGLRVLTGIALVGFYAVVESWLNGTTPSESRGKVFAVYMVVNLVALAGAQQLLRLDSPSAFTLFAVAAIFVCISLLPVTATRLPPPAISDAPQNDLRRLWQAAPVAFTGAIASGLAMGAFWSLGPLYGERSGLDAAQIATMMTTAIVGGALLQWPIGLFSDRFDRRAVLAAIALLAVAGAAAMAAFGGNPLAVLGAIFVFGAAAFAVYPVVVAHLIDHLHQDEILSGNAGILLLHGVAAALGPAFAGWLMSRIGAIALPLHFALAFAPVALFALLQARRGADEIVDEAAHFTPMLRTSPTVLEMVSPEVEHEADTAPAADAGSDDPEAEPAPPANAAPAGADAAEPEDAADGADIAARPAAA